MSDFVKYSLDYDGVEQQGGDYVAKCSFAAAAGESGSKQMLMRPPLVHKHGL